MIYYIYIHICLVTAKAYIGYSINPKGRWMEHCRLARKGFDSAFYNAIRKYGKENFESQIIGIAYSLEEIKQKEKDFIKQFNTLAPNGYNMTAGGDGLENYKHSKETIRKISKNNAKATLGKHWKWNEKSKKNNVAKRLEYRIRKSKQMMGNKNGLGNQNVKGKHWKVSEDKLKNIIKKNNDPIIKLKQKLGRLKSYINQLELELNSGDDRQN